MQRPDARPTIEQMSAFMQQAASGRISRSALDVFMKLSGDMSADDWAFAAERAAAERLFRPFEKRHPDLRLSAPRCPGVGAETIETLKRFGFMLVYVPERSAWMSREVFQLPSLQDLYEPNALEPCLTARGRWLAVEARHKSDRREDAQYGTKGDAVAEVMGLGSRFGQTVGEILVRRGKLAAALSIPYQLIRLPTCEEWSFMAQLFDGQVRVGLDYPDMSRTDGNNPIVEWCLNKYGSDYGVAMGNGPTEIQAFRPGWSAALSRVSFRLVIHLDATE